MNEQERTQVEIAISSGAKLGASFTFHPKPENLTIIHCGHVNLSEWFSVYDRKHWRSVGWKCRGIEYQKSWIVKEHPTPLAQLAEELINAI